MAEVMVFVDDAVLGRLPQICVKEGVPTGSRLRVVEEIGRSNRLGILWLLLLLGPIGWVILALLAAGDRGEHLTVVLPFSDSAYDRLNRARRLRRLALACAVLGGAACLTLTGWAHLGAAGMVLTFAVVAGSIAAVLVAEWRLGQGSVDVTVDASRRWVTLRGVHPALVDACRRQTAVHPSPTPGHSSGSGGPSA